jgi:hypothetical protein
MSFTLLFWRIFWKKKTFELVACYFQISQQCKILCKKMLIVRRETQKKPNNNNNNHEKLIKN